MGPFNLRVNIIRNYYTIDSYGGATLASGVIIHANEYARIDHVSQYSQANAKVGIEAPRSYSLLLRTNRQKRMDVQVEDIIEICFPTTDENYPKRFVVRSKQEESLHPQDPNKIIECNLVGIDYDRKEFLKPGL
jgi:hypothetical protein